jgi:hypothetical protein
MVPGSEELMVGAIPVGSLIERPEEDGLVRVAAVERFTGEDGEHRVRLRGVFDGTDVSWQDDYPEDMTTTLVTEETLEWLGAPETLEAILGPGPAPAGHREWEPAQARERAAIASRLARFHGSLDIADPSAYAPAVLVCATHPDIPPLLNILGERRPTRSDVTLDDVVDALRLSTLDRANPGGFDPDMLGRQETLLAEAAVARGGTPESLAARLGVPESVMHDALTRFDRAG